MTTMTKTMTTTTTTLMPMPRRRGRGRSRSRNLSGAGAGAEISKWAAPATLDFWLDPDSTEYGSETLARNVNINFFCID